MHFPEKLPTKKILQALIPAFISAVIVLLSILFFTPDFKVDYSFTLYSSGGKLLGASAAKDGQWRFPQNVSLPLKYKEALLTYEDKNFYFHFGIDPLSVFRAAAENLLKEKIVSGASTITMQTSRLSEKNQIRSFGQKLKESFFSLFLELAYSKEDILNLYSSHAPYGGNVVGLEAASWRYFGRAPEDLTWAEAACLAVLPNQPSLVRPGKESKILKQKRDNLLYNLFLQKKIDKETYELSLEEPVPDKPKALPQKAHHYLEFLKTKTSKPKNISTLDHALQEIVFEIAEHHFKINSQSSVHNIAVLILDTETGNPLAYIGNTGLNSPNAKHEHVDMIQARRSSGSLLKPFLFTAMLDAGMILPDQLLIDIPTKIAGYTPQNSSYTYSGAIPARKALSYSLNIPFIRSLREFTVPAFLDILKRSGFTTFNRSAGEYGLPLILGGGEINLYEITYNYRKLMLKAQNKLGGKFPFSSGACRITMDVLTEGNRPEEEAIWQLYAKDQKIAWKTGTSYGNKDAWTIGITPKYSVGVWCGNASGEGRPEITSTKLAAPILFEIFKILPKTDWPEQELKDFEFIKTCADSGYPAGEFCNNTKNILKPIGSHSQKVCPYCKKVSLTPDGKFQVKANDINELPKIEKRFILPAAAEYFYKQGHPEYKPLPRWIPGSTASLLSEFEILFPENGTSVYIPTELDGSMGALTAEAVHKNPEAVIYWDLDGEFLGLTKTYHQMKIQTTRGSHILTATDNRGNTHKRVFHVLNEN
ncbi:MULTISPECIES: penicillin-binding protein 1C [unclassified Treponema]|uniref:penicillin-binding protein 1C n=1 Tax=unclassified Treponema TaxID=2638727 RepID=UPI0020A59ECE|nr:MULTISPECIES: penicillin-binding protein 1C [unclassified Treponema]UTC67593.1 penicillin-binding protein 1C [Treponema sp. OMZ 789]UTC70320.1 penicillin-binding protein 1C [Treponema sp. OMZ 790]UTC73035.1 penicillin-binding protein 1C [Treponema sp. OMZ 791]